MKNTKPGGQDNPVRHRDHARRTRGGGIRRSRMPTGLRHLHCVLATALLTVLAAGCALPRHTTSLNRVLEDELGPGHAQAPDYRCTVGAHRGSSVTHRENTLAALGAAETEDLYAFVEFDVQYSRDHRIVVFHDKRLLRLFGSLRSIGNSEFNDLVDATEGEIVSYEDALDVLSKPLNIEIKSQGDEEEDARLADQIIADLRARGRHRDVLISSISSDVVRYVDEHHPGIPTGKVLYLTSSTYLHFDVLTRELYEDFDTVHADYLLFHVANLRNIENLLELKPKGKTIVFWDLDDKMYLVHKDRSDRLWSDSPLTAFFKRLGYGLRAPFHHRKTGEERTP